MSNYFKTKVLALDYGLTTISTPQVWTGVHNFRATKFLHGGY